MRRPKWLVDARDDLLIPPADQPLKILVHDIETSPEGNWTWGRYKQNTLGNIRPQYMISNVYHWFGSDEYSFIGQNSDPNYIPDNYYRKPRPTQDRWVVSRMWHLYDQADIVIAHNGDKFDIPFTQGRFQYYGIGPTSMFASIDTLSLVKKHFRYTSNRLNDLGHLLLNDTKKAHMGMATWHGCMQGNPEEWRRMEAYNLQDVVLLLELYKGLIPWVSRPKKLPIPNANFFTDRASVGCPAPGCGGMRVQVRGKLPPTTAGMVYRQFQCQKCGGYFRANYAERNLTPTLDRIK